MSPEGPLPTFFKQCTPRHISATTTRPNRQTQTCLRARRSFSKVACRESHGCANAASASKRARVDVEREPGSRAPSYARARSRLARSSRRIIESRASSSIKKRARHEGGVAPAASEATCGARRRARRVCGARRARTLVARRGASSLSAPNMLELTEPAHARPHSGADASGGGALVKVDGREVSAPKVCAASSLRGGPSASAARMRTPWYDDDAIVAAWRRGESPRGEIDIPSKDCGVESGGNGESTDARQRRAHPPCRAACRRPRAARELAVGWPPERRSWRLRERPTGRGSAAARMSRTAQPMLLEPRHADATRATQPRLQMSTWVRVWRGQTGREEAGEPTKSSASRGAGGRVSSRGALPPRGASAVPCSWRRNSLPDDPRRNRGRGGLRRLGEGRQPVTAARAARAFGARATASRRVGAETAGRSKSMSVTRRRGGRAEALVDDEILGLDVTRDAGRVAVHDRRARLHDNLGPSAGDADTAGSSLSSAPSSIVALAANTARRPLPGCRRPCAQRARRRDRLRVLGASARPRDNRSRRVA